MTTYYTEYPTGTFQAKNDKEALKNKAKVIYKESDTVNGLPFIVLRDNYSVKS